jgi:hypothetical protein
MLLGPGPSAFAASGTHDSDDISRLNDTLRLENVTIPWSFPLANPSNDGTGTCEAIPLAAGSINPVDNRSNRARKITREVRADGSQIIVQDDLITGMAKDSHGATYHFAYKNYVVLHVPTDVPAIVQVKMTDSFRLIGHGLHMHAGFNWRWKYEATKGVTFDLGDDGMNSNFPVVPFVFATADGVTEAPGVTDWQKLSTTRVNPFFCDPL